MKGKINSPSSEGDDEDSSNHLKAGHLAGFIVSNQNTVFKSSKIISTIRKVNPNDPEDIKRITLIDKSSEVLKYMVGKPLDKDGEIREFITDSNEKSLYIVAGSSFLPKEEVGKLQGWILVYSGKEVLERAVKALGKGVLESKLPVLEISYAKYPNAIKGQMGSGLRRVLLRLTQNGRQPLVFAYVDAENFASRYLVESAGFVLQKKRIFWDPKISKKKDLVYLLDWGRLYNRAYNTLSQPSVLETSNNLH